MRTQHEEMQPRAQDNDAPARLQPWRKLGYPKNQKKQREGQEEGDSQLLSISSNK